MRSDRIFNFGAGPAMLPIEVMEKAQKEFLNYNGMGASIIELSHRGQEFISVLDRCDRLIRELSGLPDNYKILYMPGGGQMQFSAVPLNLLGRMPQKKALFIESGSFTRMAREEASRYGAVKVIASSAGTDFDRIPGFDHNAIEQDASYAFITSNNTVRGTCWNKFPATGEVPLIVDATSDIFSRQMDFSQCGLVFAGLQKNLGPAGLGLVLVRDDLLEYAMPQTPRLLNYKLYSEEHSLVNTINTFAVYMLMLVLEWMVDRGGISQLQVINEIKAKTLYDVIDRSDFYQDFAQKGHRSTVNVTFSVANRSLLDVFLSEANERGLYALKGLNAYPSLRASIYNAMPLEGVQCLADFMKDFEHRYG